MIHVLENGAAFVAMGLVVWLTGRLPERLLPADLGPWRGLARICLGLAFWTAGGFALSAVGLLTRWSLWVLVAAVALVTVGTWLRAGAGPTAGPKPPPTRSPGDVVCAVVLVALMAPFFLWAISPPVSHDADVYHLTLPRLFIAHHGFRPVPMSVYSNWPLGTELLFAWAIMAKSYLLAKLVHFGFGLLILGAVFVACREGLEKESRWPAGWLAIAFFLANGVVAWELRVAYVELAQAFYLVTGFFFVLRSRARDPAARTFLLLAGLCAGLLAGTKLTGIVGAAMIGVSYLPYLRGAWRQGALRAAAWDFAWRFVLPVLALWMPWLVKAVWYTGNPVYPLLYPWLGGPDWSAELTAQLRTWQSSIGMGRELGDYLLLPLRVILHGGRGYDHFDGELGRFWIVLLPLAVGLGWRRALVRRCLGLAATWFLFWSLTVQQMRFLIPVLPLLAVAGAVTVADLWQRLPAGRWRLGVRWLTLAVGLGLVVTAHGRLLVAGYRTVAIYQRAAGELEESVVPAVHRFVNQQLPPEARLLFLNTNRGFFCHREYLADSFFEASQIAAWLQPATTVAALRERLSERAVTHLLVENRDRGIAWPQPLLGLLNDPRQVTVLFRSPDGRFTLLELR